MNKELSITILIVLTVAGIFYVRQSRKTDAFQQWKKTFGTPFAPEEQIYRRLIFEKNVLIIESHNANQSHSYKMGINQFSIYSDDQFKSIFLSDIILPVREQVNAYVKDTHPIVGDIDWTQRGGVSPVKNQGNCGSGYAFTTVAILQSQAKLRNQIISLSQQQLIDCTRAQKNKGCDGGSPLNALNFVKASGITTSSSYPNALREGVCKYQGGSFKIKSYSFQVGCPQFVAVINQSPIAVTVDATNWSKYSSGVFNDCANKINHAALLVGNVLGTWKLKNSWGTTWGQQGFIRITGSNTCGICENPGLTVAL